MPVDRNRTVAIVGCGIAGAVAAHTLCAAHDDDDDDDATKTMTMTVHVFDQGRGGVGGRASTRTASSSSSSSSSGDRRDGANDDAGGGDGATTTAAAAAAKKTTTMMWDHGCQFFRADTPEFRGMVEHWMSGGLVEEWRGNFVSFPPNMSPESEFFGLPSKPPFYVASRGGMHSLVRGILDDIPRGRRRRRRGGGERSPPSSESPTTSTSTSTSTPTRSSSSLRVFEGTRVADLERTDEGRWKLRGTSGIAAYHDTPEGIARRASSYRVGGGVDGPDDVLGEEAGYDAIILTDASSSFDAWHRASAGIPEIFASAVRERLGSRVPLFACMIAFDAPLIRSGVPFDAASFDDPIVWFAARSDSKPGMGDDDPSNECWTIVSTPEYAVAKIEETPMQDPSTGEFVPQSREYLTTVPGPEMYGAFVSLLRRRVDGTIDEDYSPPNVVHLDAQRWGSALPCHRDLTSDSPTRRWISGVPYDPARRPLAPTAFERGGGSFLADEGLMIFQAGDMVSDLTPGMEGAALSGRDAAERLRGIFLAADENITDER